MSAGTLTLTNDTDAVTGSGTAFTTELAAGDFIVVTVGGIPYTLPVKTVNNNTSLTLVSVYTGPTQSGAAWSAVPRVALNMVTAALVAQSAEALRGLNYDKQNWQQVYSTDGNITVKLPDGTTFTGPSWKYLSDNMATKSGGAVPLNQGGTGSTTASGARTNLGLGSSATKNTGTTSNDVMQPGMFGLGLAYGAITTNSTNFSSLINDNFTTKGTGLCAFRNDAQVTSGDTPFYQYSPSLFFRTRDTFAVLNFHFNGGPIRVFAGGINETNLITSTNGRALWDTKNTAVDSNGFIKQASPVVKIFTDGKYETNDESEGVTVTRLDVGQYLIEGCKALNSDAAWGGIDGGFEIPTDRNKQPLIWLDYEVNADGSVLVKTYHREHPSAPAFARNERAGLADGEPVDIPADQFVSVRVEMPADSIWNQKQAEEALKQEQGS
ncbi:phage tail protein [Salmonella enterica subsp. enterica]|uniref:Phage tail protein n=1 Tax=Salmonella enterica subsp. enterica serovar Cerro TaxID=340188 RepID=A0A6C8M3G6_SALET|nr:phage tail protein [Salmonella enterica]EHT1696842.1 phage tail protein [Salmonella enterica subsp. enterica serovar Senftenberg]EAP8141679.1 phage tail protein [Salmonella enterica]EAQ7481257.1 phage tail protein [Salmonella enterica]EAV7694893.1 phage tail protein [Salmonella enterica]EBA0303983.1 phage tail protein [Salmonella enterica subsp. enterica serovar Cerro]